MDPMTMQMMYNPAAMMQRIGGYQMPQAQNQLTNLMQAMQQYRQGSGYQPGSATTGPMPTNMDAMRQAMTNPQAPAQNPMAGTITQADIDKIKSQLAYDAWDPVSDGSYWGTSPYSSPGAFSSLSPLVQAFKAKFSR